MKTLITNITINSFDHRTLYVKRKNDKHEYVIRILKRLNNKPEFYSLDYGIRAKTLKKLFKKINKISDSYKHYQKQEIMMDEELESDNSGSWEPEEEPCEANNWNLPF